MEPGPIFLVPLSRTGSTLMVTMLDAHPRVAMSYELYENILRNDDGTAIDLDWAIDTLRRARPWVGPHGWWLRRIRHKNFRTFLVRARRGIEVPDILTAMERYRASGGSFASLDGRLDLLDELMRLKMRNARKDRWGGKAPTDARTLFRRHPNAHFLFMVRDGRDVLASQLNVGDFRTDPVRCAREWKESLEDFRDFARTPGVQAFEVPYEKLVRDPEPVLREISDFVDIAYDPVTRHFERQDLSLFRNPQGQLSAKQVQGGLNDQSLGRWRRDLSLPAVRTFEGVAGDLLRDCGYERATLDNDASVAADVASMRESGTSEPWEEHCSFPFEYAAGFLRFLARNADRIEMLTYDDFAWEDDFDAQGGYPDEYTRWRRSLRRGERSKAKIHLLLHHDMDARPERTLAFLREEERLGLKSSVMIFHRRVDRSRLQASGEVAYTDYPCDFEYFQRLQQEHGFAFGYHSNALEQARFDRERALGIFEDDVRALRERLRVHCYSPHGGARGPDGESNVALVPRDPRGLDLRWVQNRCSPWFAGHYSDGGINSGALDPRRRDLRAFVRRMRPGRRYRILLHPQYFHTPWEASSRLSGARWYGELLRSYTRGIDPWDEVRLLGS